MSENATVENVTPTPEERIFSALSTTKERSFTQIQHAVRKPRIAKAMAEAALDGLVASGRVARRNPPALPEGQKRGRGRPAVAKFMALIPAPLATTPAADPQ